MNIIVQAVNIINGNHSLLYGLFILNKSSQNGKKHGTVKGVQDDQVG